MNTVPVIAIDGPSASGKGTVAQRVAQRLGWHYLDSGAIYRLAALAAIQKGVALTDEPALAKLARHLDISFAHNHIYLDGETVDDAVRAEETGNAASAIATLPALRAALLDRQRAFRQAPGLVADGRDMASVVFTDAKTKIYLTATAEIRAQRRYRQLLEKGLLEQADNAIFDRILQDIRDRDARDSARTVAPLQQSTDAALLDTTELGIDEAVNQVLALHHRNP
ncbi:cytidylate kinase [Chitinivorax tropicus]|uniref:Cytidylate kinase n=1 Tax=Chitinivorax tropicus TaxID=714531 RepID=A0A840MQ43_9PROT|nr:(d)CMP kinase [Chitinivorax tropicus]MBB5018586.1 cytidylate kinase [Chitinivorax tropicus]